MTPLPARELVRWPSWWEVALALELGFILGVLVAPLLGD